MYETVKEGDPVCSFKVKPIPGLVKKSVIASHLFGNANPNVGLIAKKETGKTTVLYNVLEEVLTDDSIVIFFVSTIKRDKSYEMICRRLRERGIKYIIETSFKDEEGNDQLKMLSKYLNSLGADIWRELDDFNQEDSEDEDPEAVLSQYQDLKIRRRGVKRAYASAHLYTAGCEMTEEPEEEKKLNVVIIIDDMSAELKTSRSIEGFLKANRHVDSKIFISTQNVSDMPGSALNSLDYVLAFAGIPEDPKNNELLKLYSKLSLSVPYNEFRDLYMYATAPEKPGKKSHSFLYIDIRHNLFRKNFDVPLHI